MAKLVTTFHDLMNKRPNLNYNQLAKKIGISRNTLSYLRDDKWVQIQRETIEKICEFFRCDINGLFHIEEDPFWIPFMQKNNLQVIFGGEKSSVEEKAIIGMWDIKVVNEIVTHLYYLGGSKRPETAMISNLDFHGNEKKIIDFIRKHNTLIIGSPKVNDITEIVISRLFGADPFDSSPENRSKLPFWFVRPKKWGDCKREGAFNEISREGKRGIYSQKLDKIVAENEYFREFFKKPIEKGKDCGILLVVNNPFDSNEMVKLIILAGYTGASSFAMSKYIVSHANQLEPRGSKPLIRVFQMYFKKPSAEIDDRTITEIKIVDQY